MRLEVKLVKGINPNKFLNGYRSTLVLCLFFELEDSELYFNLKNVKVMMNDREQVGEV